MSQKTYVLYYDLDNLALSDVRKIVEVLKELGLNVFALPKGCRLEELSDDDILHGRSLLCEW